MPSGSHLSHFNLKVDGSQASKEFMDSLLECTVENSLHLPDMCTFRIRDVEFKWVDSDLLKEGVKIEVEGGEETGGLVTIFKGEITGIELDMAAQGTPTAVVRSLDKSHRLHRGRYNRSFVQMKDSDIVQRVAGELGLSVHADATSQVHDWVFQKNQTNWEFLTERAARNGYRLYVKDESDLYFKKVDDASDGTVELTWGMNLRSFRPRTAASQQMDEVVVRGWDPTKKAAIVGSWQSPAGVPKTGGNGNGGQVASQAFGSAKMIVVDKPIQSQKEAEDLAKSVCDSIGGSYIEAEGLCYGQPDLKPGKMVEIKNIGKRFSGKYYVTSTTHTYTPAEGYSTIFVVSGKQPSTLLSALEGSKGVGRSPMGGNILIGIVTDNKDPENKGRVKVKYPTLTEEHTSHWARLVSPMAGKNRGLFILPEIDDEVLIAFEHGDIHRPYVLGMLWNGKDALPETAVHGDGSVVDRRVFYTRIGHQMAFNDKDGKGDITLKTKGNHQLVMDDKEQKIVATTTGNHQLTLDDKNKNITAKSSSGHKIVLNDQSSQIQVIDKTGGNKITISSSDNSMKLECNGNFTIDSKGKVSIKGMAGVEVKTPAMMNIESTGPGTLKSSAILTVQGTLVKIN